MSSYAATSDLALYGSAGAALEELSDEEKAAAITAASSLADGYLATRYRLPVVTPSQDLTEAVCKIAAYNLLASRGYNPELGADEILRARYDDAIAWLKGVAKGEISPPLIDSTPGGSPNVGGPFVLTPVTAADGTVAASAASPRGW